MLLWQWFQILDYSVPGGEDYVQLTAALEEAESLCSKVNEAVRSKENTEQLEWLQSHVHLTINEVKVSCRGATL